MRTEICSLACFGLTFVNGGAQAQSPVTGGSGVMKFDLPTLLGQTPLDAFDAVFGITETYDELLSLPGNNPGSAVAWDFNPIGTPSPAGRLIQSTSLDIDPADVLATWGPATNDNGAFVKGGEQIGFGGMTR